ncbi:sensor histidine kinase YesM [Evansella vedderi]|uniref:histidine kinase n=1 Tax=Evansella vedderi TaxID=38282 RepID=A0ABT9ZPW1_9BACI|nr:histidine kinase [Evansella vedderi]MDQ0253276.1 sensor histidine kinase YesM [Evansella vedderi]
MIKIRTKLLIYFTVIVLFTLVISYVQNQSHERAFDLYEESLNHLFLKNEISQKTKDTYQSLYTYVLEPLEDNLSNYEENRRELLSLQERLLNTESFMGDAILMKNYQHLMDSFLEQSDNTINGVNEQKVQVYSYHLNEAEKTQQYIHDTTLDIINRELTSHQQLYPIIEQKVNYTNKMGTAIFISILLLGILFALWFSNGITKTITHLTDAAEQISAGSFTGKDVQVSTKDELWFLTKTFNQMKENINHSVKEIEEKARLKELLKETELRSLQNQINPHFLFNTLNTISKTAYIEDAERTSELISSVSALLRYNLGDIDKAIVLGDEVEIVKEYFFIQKTRFGDRVQFEENIEESCLTTPIPCLTLQPIVENAFMHGVEEMKKGAKIQLTIYEKNHFVFIEVRDNGVGMDKETVEKLFHPQESEAFSTTKRTGHSTGIGLINVISRLQLFDSQNEVRVDSQLGQGTTVTIKLVKQGHPINKPKEGRNRT